jgi:hypothetical protein
MAIELEFFSLTGMLGNAGATGILNLNSMPSTGPYGTYDIAVDPVDGPAQVLGTDYSVTGQAGSTGGAIRFDLPASSIRDVLLNLSHGVTGPLNLRVLYNY